MDPREGFRMSWRAIRSHKLRSTLTTLGVIIGIGAVITFVALGASLQAAVIGQVGGDQPPNVNVWSGPEQAVDTGQGGPGFGAQPVLTEYDLEQLRTVDEVAAVVPVGQVATTALTYRNDSVATGGVVATTPQYLVDEPFSEGRTFEVGAREAVLNPAAARAFEENVTAGETVTMTLTNGSTAAVTVVGILESSGAVGPFEGFGSAPRVYVPAEPFYATRVASPTAGNLQRVYPTAIVVAESATALDSVQSATRAYLEGASDAGQLQPRGFAFAVQTNEELVGQILRLLDQFTGFITGIALLSLLVGSIGIANIMLVSVTERTREIGIMKAVGAQNRDVLQLFLLESVILGAIGATLGTLLGLGGGYAVTQVLDFPFSVPLVWLPVAVGVGMVVGVVAGLYPAWRAARTDPIDALRYE
jgi:putative ABC transport system permease protein